MIRKILLAVLLLIVVAIAGFAIYVASRQNIRIQAASPAITASSDSAVIARGRYIVRAVAGCAGCHGDPTQKDSVLAGLEVPLSGGHTFDIPPGKFHVLNITPDPETGIGAIPDSLLARALRYGVRHDGRVLLPFMEFQGLSDEDLTAVISYLRSQPPVHNRVPPHEPNLLGRIVLATSLSTPVGPKSPPPAVSPSGPTVENGRYLVEHVALCGACHTARNQATGEYTGAPLAGQTDADEDPVTHRKWSPPNITSAPRTGRLARFTEDQFVARMHAGPAYPGTPMPWAIFGRMHDDDLRAIYRYLRTLPAVENDPGPPYVDPKS